MGLSQSICSYETNSLKQKQQQQGLDLNDSPIKTWIDLTTARQKQKQNKYETRKNINKKNMARVPRTII